MTPFIFSQDKGQIKTYWLLGYLAGRKGKLPEVDHVDPTQTPEYHPQPIEADPMSDIYHQNMPPPDDSVDKIPNCGSTPPEMNDKCPVSKVLQHTENTESE